jgi:SSS family solute:Na+ symporter
MGVFDWLLVVGLNGVIVLYGLRLARGTKDTSDWFLAAKGLPWWMVGLSLFATAVDSGDYVAVIGGAYQYGISNISTWWLGLPLGWFIVSYVVILPIYRSGMFTNAEYLEYRFGPATRCLSAFIQLQSRTNVLGNIAFSLFLTFSVVTGWGDETWILVVLIALAAAHYTAKGGLKAVAVTDSLQSVVMLAAAAVLWVTIWREVGGWSGLETRLAEHDPEKVSELLHVGGRTTEGVSPILLLVGWVITLMSYCIVNQSQAMRMLAARSEWDLKMAALVASVITVVVMGFNISLGVLGRGIDPDMAHPDRLYPELVRDYLGPGLIGVVVAGILAGGLSTYDSIGSALSSVFTRDVYARFIRRRADDAHYLRVSRWMTYGVILLSFAYVPFLKNGMVGFYLRLTSVAVVPLATVYVVGVLTRVHRSSGAIGLAAGIVFGVSSFLGAELGWDLPELWTDKWWAYVWGPVVTAGTMFGVSLVRGFESHEALAGLLYRQSSADFHVAVSGDAETDSDDTWLEATRRRSARQSSARQETAVPFWQQPLLWSLLFLAIVAWVNLVVLW